MSVRNGGFYRGAGWVWTRLDSWWRGNYRDVFAMIKTGVAPMEFIVAGNEIVLRNPVTPRRFAERMALGFTLDARTVEFSPERPVFRPTLKLREALVISGEWRGKRLDLALAPLQRDDLERLREALSDAGVRAGMTEAEWSRASS